MGVADIVRLFCAALAVLLVPACIYAVFTHRMSLDQRVRFAALALLGVVIAGGQLDNLGQPGNWRMPVLATGLAAAVAGTVMYLVKLRRDTT